MTDIRPRNQCPECGWSGEEPNRVMHRHRDERIPKYLKVRA